jgi:hypothetical protein
MSTKLLEQVRAQDQAALAAEHNGETKQARRVWCVQYIKADITEAEWFAANRAVEDCGAMFQGKADGVGFQMYRCPKTGLLTSGKEQSILRQTHAMQALEGLRQGVANRCSVKNAANGAEWIVQRHTMQDMAAETDWWRNKGKDRAPSPDMSRIRPFMRLVLLAMAAYYDDCGEAKAA